MSIIQRLIEKKQLEKSAQDTSQPNNGRQSDRVEIPQRESGNVFSEKQKTQSEDTKKPIPNQNDSNNEVILDFKDLEKKGFLSPSVMDSQLAEEYRRIKRPILVNAFERSPAIKNGNIVLITSSLPNEGKSYTALNMAMSISMERDKTVLLVDGDLQLAGLTSQFNLNGMAGLADVLNHEGIDIKDTIYKTNIDNLKIIPAGNRMPHSAELLASSDMQLLVQELSNRYSDRIIIVDSPPLLARSESSVLAKLLGQVVVVVQAEQTMQTVLKEALEQLEECEIVNLILNKRHNRPGMSYYSGYYGY